MIISVLFLFLIGPLLAIYASSFFPHYKKKQGQNAIISEIILIFAASLG